jgi:hypothetical protein
MSWSEKGLPNRKKSTRTTRLSCSSFALLAASHSSGGCSSFDGKVAVPDPHEGAQSEVSKSNGRVCAHGASGTASSKVPNASGVSARSSCDGGSESWETSSETALDDGGEGVGGTNGAADGFTGSGDGGRTSSGGGSEGLDTERASLRGGALQKSDGCW